MGPRLLVISPPCHQPVNRAVYRELAERGNVEVCVVAPSRLFVGNNWRDTPRSDDAPYQLALLEMVGTHGRLQRLKGLADFIRSWKPTHILVDSDPATMLVWQAAQSCNGAALWALTAENLAPRYGRDFIAGLKALRPGLLIGPPLTFLLRMLTHRHVDRVFTLSRDGTQVMEGLGFRGRTTQIPLGFDPGLFRIQSPDLIAKTRAKLGLVRPTVAYFGRLTPEKGVHLLLESLATMRDLAWQFLIDEFSVYQTDYAKRLQEKMRELGIADRVVHFDAKHDEMPDYMNAADIVVLPSLSMPKWKEQYGRVLPEAMACGKIVVGSDCGAIPELVATHGRIFPEGEVVELTKLLRQLVELDPSERQALGTNASAYAHANLSITKQADIWQAMLTRS